MFGQKIDKRLFSIKGGCNLRFYYNSIRYSEDIDIDVQIIAVSTLRKKVNLILSSDTFHQILGSRGIILNNYSELKQSETTQRWKLELGIPNSSLVANTRIKFSCRENIVDILVEPISPHIIQLYQLMPIISCHYSVLAVFQQKIRALVHRKLTQNKLFHLLPEIELPKKFNFKLLKSMINKIDFPRRRILVQKKFKDLMDSLL